MKKNEMPEEIIDIITMLEAKNVARMNRSYGHRMILPPDMTPIEAARIYQHIHTKLQKSDCKHKKIREIMFKK